MGSPDRDNLRMNLAGLPLRTPIVLAAGTCGYADEIGDVLDLECVGAITSKSITVEPRNGNPPWRILDVPAGMLNAIGLANVGLETFLREKLGESKQVTPSPPHPLTPSHSPPLIGSVAGNSIDEYAAIARAFDEHERLAAIELNVSCPNTEDGLIFGEHPQELKSLLREVRPAVTRKPLIVKLSPNAPIAPMAGAAVEGGADALTLINTITALAIDVETRRPRISHGTAGYSGPAIHPIALRMVHEAYRSVARAANVPIIGLGGVMRWEDAAEFILAGATAVGVGTALFVDPRLPMKIARGLSRWVERQGCASVGELVGKVEMKG